jgi:hypothetical protein
VYSKEHYKEEGSRPKLTWLLTSKQMLEEGLDQLHRQAVWHIVCYDGRLEKGFEACSLPLGPRCRTYPLERVFSQLDEQRGCVELAYRSAARSLLGLVTDPRLSGSSLTKLNINILHHALYNEGQSTPFAKELEVPPPRTGDARYSAPASGLRDPLGVRLVALSSGSRGTGLRDRCGSGGCARGGF